MVWILTRLATLAGSICFMYLGTPILGAYILMSVKSSSYIDPFPII